MNVHEAEFIRVFVAADKRDRYLSLFETKKGRRKLTNRLCHNHDLDTKLLHMVSASDHSVGAIVSLLKKRGAPSMCYVISASSLDAQQMPLETDLSETIGYGAGTVISCIPGKLGYFEAEDKGERYLLW